MKRASFVFFSVLVVLLFAACSNPASDSSSSSAGSSDSDYASPIIGTLKYVPAGSFQRDPDPDNISVITHPFRISATEITRAQFLAVMGEDPSNPTYSGGPNDPVQSVNWYHAIAFCDKLSIAEGLTPVYGVTKAGVPINFGSLDFWDIPYSDDLDWNAASVNWSANGYRLPTDMERMWAAMGADLRNPGAVNTTGYADAFAGSTGSNSVGNYAVFGYYSSETGKTTTPSSSSVGTKLPNDLGLYDMSGNIDEWCWDLYDTLPSGTVIDYTGPPGPGASRVRRGGSWGSTASGCTVAYRYNDFAFGVSYFIGFRVVRT